MRKIGMIFAMSMGLMLVACHDKNPAEDPKTNPTTDTTTPIVDTTAQVVDTISSENIVKIVYDGTTAQVSVPQNLLRYLTIAQSGAHVSITQSSDLADEITYTLSGNSSNGGFYMSGSYKATIELNGLTLTNVSATYSGAAVHVQNDKRIKVKVITGTTNTLVDAANGSQKGCLYIKGHAEFAQKGTLNVTGKTNHGIKTGEYFSTKNATINVLSAVGDGINCAQYFLMESGTINISGVGDDGIQCDIDDTTTGSTGQTTDHEDEDSGNIYVQGGTIQINCEYKGIKAEKDLYVTDGIIHVTSNAAASSGGGGGPGGGGSSQKLVVYTSSTPTLKSGVTAGGTEIFGGQAYYPATATGGSNVTLSNYSSGGGSPW